MVQSQSIAGAVPHALGIFTGHVYHFFYFIWPQLGGKRYMAPPGVLEQKLSQDKKSSNNKKSGEAKGIKISRDEKSAAKSKKSSVKEQKPAKSSSSKNTGETKKSESKSKKSSAKGKKKSSSGKKRKNS